MISLFISPSGILNGSSYISFCTPPLYISCEPPLLFLPYNIEAKRFFPYYFRHGKKNTQFSSLQTESLVTLCLESSWGFFFVHVIELVCIHAAWLIHLCILISGYVQLFLAGQLCTGPDFQSQRVFLIS